MDVSIISINYNNSKLTLDFVNSVIKHTPDSIKYEIIVVDNCSKIENYQELVNLLKDTPKVKIVRSTINTGFGGGNMLGVQYASGKYLAFINNDIIFTEDCFSSLINLMKDDDSIGVSTPQQYNGKNEAVTCFDHFHGIRKVIFGNWLVEATSNKPKRLKIRNKKTISVDFIQGCFMFFDSEKFAKIGGFDTNIFLYYEEMDICYRLQKNGYKSIVHPETTFIHLHGGSTSSNFAIKQELKISQFYVLIKNHSFLKYLIIKNFMLFKYFFKSIFKPNYWKLVSILSKGAYLENSLKHQQKIYF